MDRVLNSLGHQSRFPINIEKRLVGGGAKVAKEASNA